MNTDNFVFDLIRNAGSEVLEKQSVFQRRKNTFITLANALAQVVQVAVVYTAGGPEWLSLALLVVGFLIEIVVHAGTKGSVTPSNVEAIAAEAARKMEPSAIETEVPDRTGVVSFSDNAPELSAEAVGRHALQQADRAFRDLSDGFSSYIKFK